MTCVTHRRAPLFRDAAAMCVSAALETPRLWHDATLLAWLLMPDHWHGLVVLGERSTLSTVMQRLKANSARRLHLEMPAVGRVWAAGFHDRALRREEMLVGVARYIVLNPLRAGLVRRVGEYPFWNAAWV